MGLIFEKLRAATAEAFLDLLELRKELRDIDPEILAALGMADALRQAFGEEVGASVDNAEGRKLASLSTRAEMLIGETKSARTKNLGELSRWKSVWKRLPGPSRLEDFRRILDSSFKGEEDWSSKRDVWNVLDPASRQDIDMGPDGVSTKGYARTMKDARSRMEVRAALIKMLSEAVNRTADKPDEKDVVKEFLNGTYGLDKRFSSLRERLVTARYWRRRVLHEYPLRYLWLAGWIDDVYTISKARQLDDEQRVACLRDGVKRTRTALERWITAELRGGVADGDLHDFGEASLAHSDLKETFKKEYQELCNHLGLPGDGPDVGQRSKEINESPSKLSNPDPLWDLATIDREPGP